MSAEAAKGNAVQAMHTILVQKVSGATKVLRSFLRGKPALFFGLILNRHGSNPPLWIENL
jgi:hypothetical protein